VAGFAGSPYVDQARLLIARDNLIANPERTIAELAQVMNESRDPGLSMIARLRLARAQAYREQYDAALATLAVDDSGEFAARISEIRGDIQAARGEVDAARRSYTEALTGQGADSLDRNFLQMKLSDLQPTTTEPEADGA
jgi:predicted negative regulator of RcsB-dependent stress response